MHRERCQIPGTLVQTDTSSATAHRVRIHSKEFGLAHRFHTKVSSPKPSILKEILQREHWCIRVFNEVYFPIYQFPD